MRNGTALRLIKSPVCLSYIMLIQVRWNEIAREYSPAFYDSETSPNNPKWHGNRLKLIIN